MACIHCGVPEGAHHKWDCKTQRSCSSCARFGEREKKTGGDMGTHGVNIVSTDAVCWVAYKTKPLPQSILAQAEELVCGDRQSDYGSPVECMRLTAELFYAMTGIRLTPTQCATFNKAQKIIRQRNKTKRDNRTDEAGYLLIESLCEEWEAVNGSTSTSDSSKKQGKE